MLHRKSEEVPDVCPQGRNLGAQRWDGRSCMRCAGKPPDTKPQVATRNYSEKGLLYSHVNFEEERPHTEADLAGADPNNLVLPLHGHQGAGSAGVRGARRLDLQAIRSRDDHADRHGAEFG